MQVVIVESPAKAKTINKYLGSGYKVLASLGMCVICLPRMGLSYPTRTSKWHGKWTLFPAKGSRK